MAFLSRVIEHVRRNQAERDAVTHQAVPILATFMVAAYSTISFAHILLLSPQFAAVMLPVSAGTVVASLGTVLACRCGWLNPPKANLTMTALSILLFTNAGLHVWVTGDPKESVNLALAVVCLGLFHLSPAYFVTSLLIAVAVWVGLVQGLMSPEDSVHFAFFLLSCSIVSVIAFCVRWFAYSRLISLRRQAEDREKALQEALFRMRLAESAERDSRAKSEFLANMSHELRTPLNAIIGFSEVIKNQLMGPMENPVYADYAKDIHESGNNLLRLLNDILEVSRGDTHSAPSEETVCATEDLFARVVALVRGRGNGPLLTLTIEVDPAVSRIACDELRLKRALLHLASNAVKYTPPGGRVRLRAYLEEREDGSSQIVFAVADSGRGMNPEEIASAFQEFWRSREAYVSDQGGAGLGLPLAREFARQHGGDLTLHSTPGEGLTARLVLPGRYIVPSWPSADARNEAGFEPELFSHAPCGSARAFGAEGG